MTATFLGQGPYIQKHWCRPYVHDGVWGVLTAHNVSLTGVLMQLEFSSQPPFEFSHSLMSVQICIYEFSFQTFYPQAVCIDRFLHRNDFSIPACWQMRMQVLPPAPEDPCNQQDKGRSGNQVMYLCISPPCDTALQNTTHNNSVET